jgi:hypothetical protein
MNSEGRETDARALLGVLIDEPSTHFSRTELVNEMGWWPGRVDDALGELNRAGLVHRRDGFAFASRAAVRGRELGA